MVKNFGGSIMKIYPKTSGALLTVVAALSFAANLPAQAQDLFEADWSIWYSGNNIYQFTPDGAKTTFALGVFQAVGLAFDSSSNLFVANGEVGTITKITPNGTQSTFASGLSYSFGLAFNAVGSLFEADMGSGNIYQFTPDGTQSTFASGLNRPCALAADSAGNLFESDQGSGNIYKFTPAGVQSTFGSGSPWGINGLAFNSAGYLFLADESSGNIYKFAPDGTRSTFASGLNSPSGLAIDDAGDVFVGDEGNGTIYKFTPDGTPSVFATGLNVPNGLAFQRSPGTLTPRILRVPADYPTIQWAINEASYFITDTVLVTNGIYYENLDFGGKAVTVTSVNGPQVTIIDGSAAGAVVNFSSGETLNSIITGFTITNGGISVSFSSPTVISNIIVNCGIGVNSYFGSPYIYNNLITGCSAGAIYLGGAGSAIIQGNVIQNNGQSSQPAIVMAAAGSPTINNNLIGSNYSDAILMYNQCDANIVQNIIVGNGGNGVWAGVPSGNRGPFIINNTISGNGSQGINGGAGINLSGFIGGSEIINNIATGAPALILAPWDGSSPVIEFNDFYSVEGNIYTGGVVTNLNDIDGNISANPSFACEPSRDYHLLPGSPCIDAGTNDSAYLLSFDFDGNPRILAGISNNVPTVDMGAYEFNPLHRSVPCMFINCQADIVTNTAPGQNSLVVNFPTPAGTPVANITCSPPTVSTFYGGTNVVTCTAAYGTNTASCSFNVIVIVAPTITKQPQNLQVAAGRNFTLSVGVAGTPPTNYLWRYQGNVISGANDATHHNYGCHQAANDGIYSVFVYNAAGATNSSLAACACCPPNPPSCLIRFRP